MSEDKTKIHRLAERGTTDRSRIDAILDDGMVCHLAYVVDGRPVVIPTLYARDGARLLLHGSTTSGMARAVRRGSPLSVAITHIDGIVVARSGFHSSANYRSVVIHGYGRLLDGEEHWRALDVIVDALIPGRLTDIRGPSDRERKQTAVIEIPLDEVSAKTREGGPHDDSDDLGSEVWAGIVPLSLVAGPPIPADDVKPGVPVPDYLRSYRR